MSNIGSANPGAGFRPSAEDGKAGPGVDFNPNMPVGPAPAVTSFQTASAQTMAQKQALLDAIAQNGTAGKQMFAQQQAALQGVRQGAISSQLSSDMAGPYGAGAAGAGLGAANASSTQALTAAQGNLSDLANANERANANYYDAINDQIPLAQAHTQQQVNAIKARQDLAKQAFEQEQARLAAAAQAQQLDLQIKQQELEKAKTEASGAKALTPLQQAQLALDQQRLDAGNDKAQQTPDQINLMNDAIQHLGGPGSHGFTLLTNLVSNNKTYANAMAALQNALSRNDPLTMTPHGAPLNMDVINSYLQRYYGISGK